jgi:hypothetical protein
MLIRNHSHDLDQSIAVAIGGHFMACPEYIGSIAQSVPPLINSEGNLTDQNGAPSRAVIYGIQFRIWDSGTVERRQATSDLIWGQQPTVSVQTNGASMRSSVGSTGQVLRTGRGCLCISSWIT